MNGQIYNTHMYLFNNCGCEQKKVFKASIIISVAELRVRLAPLNRFKPSSKIFYWPFQGGSSFVDIFVSYVFVNLS